jgi:hypothetical protein
MAYLVFDIETAAIPFDQLEESQQEYITRGCQTEEERQKQIDFMSLNPLTSQVVSIGMLHAGSTHAEPRGCIYSNSAERTESQLDDGTKWCTMPEADLLEQWWKVLGHRRGNGGLHLISFNGRNFDCPFLMLRSAVLRVRPSRNLMDGSRWRYDHHTDLIDELSFKGFDRQGAMRRFNFDFYCKSFGIHSPKSEGVTGNDVPRLFREGEHRQIAEYCMRDVRATWELFKVWKEYLSEEMIGVTMEAEVG